MRWRRVHGCYMHNPTKSSCIEKIYKVQEDMTAFVKEVENFIQAEYFDDGIEVIQRPALHCTGISYSLNKRNRWKLVEKLPAVVPKLRFGDPSDGQPEAGNKKRKGRLPAETQKLYGQYFRVAYDMPFLSLFQHRSSPTTFSILF
ncbi:hypothetical protein RvY_18581-2 [Ramazzottius varieornatus]|uniref:Uncharacterized protein n=1 Tax=Ramazzottius varieornatus TaxID=947166 RepID=A0A1D1W6L8_RAMVA|nr:hypothetical protein RvY_18581-2 [Ramazzottius varieornatus]